MFVSPFDFRDVFTSKIYEITCLFNSVSFPLTENSILLGQTFKLIKTEFTEIKIHDFLMQKHAKNQKN